MKQRGWAVPFRSHIARDFAFLNLLNGRVSRKLQNKPLFLLLERVANKYYAREAALPPIS